MPDVTLTEVPECGLSSADVARRVAAGQTNSAPPHVNRTVGQILRANVLTRINAIYGVLVTIAAAVGPLQDCLFGFLIVVNSGIGIVQELRARRTLARLEVIGQARARVLRDGVIAELPPAGLVLDDVIDLGPGDQITVDGTVLSGTALEVDESLLTGESDPVLKEPGQQVLSGSFVAAGAGRYRATRVGPDAYAARLAAEASRFTLVDSQLRTGIDRILRLVTYLLVPAGALTIYNQLAGDQALPDALSGMVAALVPMVPEGLVLMTSVAFAVGVIRLGRRNCLVQELPAIETLARVDVVCTDKTGTLTENGMRVSDLRMVTGDADTAEQALAALAACDSRPNASMQAIAARYPDDPQWRPTAVVPFSSARKWSGADFDGHGAWVLGAPDVLLDGATPVAAEAEARARTGQRVLLLAAAPERLAEVRPGQLTPVALVVLEQRLRADALDTVRYFEAEGVAVKVLSGDSAAAVGAVATALAMPDHTAVDARQLPDEPDRLAQTMAGATAFGRVVPEQKRGMVQALQANGHTVAMTGDGVNDVLALKEADIGVAMGSGSPATRAVAQIVLLDDKFATLPHVVAEGRRVIGNIERVSNLFLTKTVYSVLLALLVGIAQVPYPFLPRHISIIAWFTIGVPAFFLALAPNQERARPHFVSRVMRLAIPAGAAISIATFGSYLLVYQGSAATATDRVQAGTTALITLVVQALWVLTVVARPLAWWKAGLIAAMAALCGLALVVPWLREFFALDPSNIEFTGSALACAAGGIVLIEVSRWINRGLERRAMIAAG